MEPKPAPPPSASLSRLYFRCLKYGCFVIFALAVYHVQGPQPTLTPDHIVYLSNADEIIRKQPTGNYWAEWNSVRSLGVLLAYLRPYTDSHIQSLKVILLVNSVLFLTFFDLLAGLFIKNGRHRLLFTLISGMAVSFGVASWGLTDYTALLPRTLGAPWIMLCFWIYLGFRGKWIAYLAFPLLVLFSILHLSAFHALGVLIALEAVDWAVLRRFGLSRRLVYFPVSLVLAVALLLILQATGKSVRWPFLSPATAKSPASVGPAGIPTVSLPPAPRYTPQLAWNMELSMRGWRNMPIPLVNLANIAASFALIATLAIIGVLETRRRGWTQFDRLMLCFAGAILSAALGLQTLMWILRNLRPVYPLNFEEIRALSFLMIPALYFSYRLFAEGLTWPVKIPPTLAFKTAVCTGLLVLPLAMKSLTPSVRRTILQGLTWAGIVDQHNEAAMENARQALGLAHAYRYYYDTRQVAQWLRLHAPKGSLVLTDRDDLLGDGLPIIGTRQQVALVNLRQNPQAIKNAFLEAKTALQSSSTDQVIRVAQKYHATHAIVPWQAKGGVYQDELFTILLVPPVSASFSVP